MLTGKLLGEAEWLVDIGLLAVWFPKEGPTQEDKCPSLRNAKSEIQALKCPFPSRLQAWKYFLVQKPVSVLVLQELRWQTCSHEKPWSQTEASLGRCFAFRFI